MSGWVGEKLEQKIAEMWKKKLFFFRSVVFDTLYEGEIPQFLGLGRIWALRWMRILWYKDAVRFIIGLINRRDQQKGGGGFRRGCPPGDS